MNQGQRRRRRHRRAPAPAHRAALGDRRELLPDHREDQGASAAARRRAPGHRRRLAATDNPVHVASPSASPARRARHPARTRIESYDRQHLPQPPVRLHLRHGVEPGQARPRRDAQGRRHHGRRHRRAGEDRRGRRSRRRHGARARARRHPRPGRRLAHERPRHDRRHHRGRLDPGDGEGPHRALRRGAGAAGARRRLHRRVRGALARRLREPHRQVGLHRSLRLRCDQPRRGAPPHQRGRGDDPLEGRGRHRRRLRGHQAHPQDLGRDQRASVR